MSINDLECTYNVLDNTYTFNSTDNWFAYFTCYGYSSIMKVLGFEINQGDYSSNLHTDPSLTSTRQIYLSGNNSFYFTTNLQTDTVLFFNTVSVSNHVSTITNSKHRVMY